MFIFFQRGPHCQGRNEGDKGGAISRAPNDCGGTRKSQQFRKYFLQYSTFASERPQVRTWGRQTYILPRAPPNLVTTLRTVTQKVKDVRKGFKFLKCTLSLSCRIRFGLGRSFCEHRTRFAYALLWGMHKSLIHDMLTSVAYF